MNHGPSRELSPGETLPGALKLARGGPSSGRPARERFRQAPQKPGLARKSSQDPPPSAFPGGGAWFSAEDDELPSESINPLVAAVAPVVEIAGRWQELLTSCQHKPRRSRTEGGRGIAVDVGPVGFGPCAPGRCTRPSNSVGCRQVRPSGCN